MTDRYLEFLFELHLPNKRQGPGCDDFTLKMFKKTGIDPTSAFSMLDAGCGTGAASLLFAQETNAKITAVDISEEFLQELERRAKELELFNRISTIHASMGLLPDSIGLFDLIWSEGAIYTIGFKKGIDYFQSLIKPGGYLAISEITWFTDERPDELEAFWNAHYAEMGTFEQKERQLFEAGYTNIQSFRLPESCWTNEYFSPLEKSLDDFLNRHPNDAIASALVQEQKDEIELYDRFKNYFGYGFYIAKKAK
jgi:cyclopropane fatty-acyl-phospholipid synthase-like methyltransferase